METFVYTFVRVFFGCRFVLVSQHLLAVWLLDDLMHPPWDGSPIPISVPRKQKTTHS